MKEEWCSIIQNTSVKKLCVSDLLSIVNRRILVFPALMELIIIVQVILVFLVPKTVIILNKWIHASLAPKELHTTILQEYALHAHKAHIIDHLLMLVFLVQMELFMMMLEITVYIAHKARIIIRKKVLALVALEDSITTLQPMLAFLAQMEDSMIN